MNVNANISNEQDEDDWVEPEEDVEMVRHRGLILALPWSTVAEEWFRANLPRAFRYQGCVVVEPGDLAEFLAAMRRDGLDVKSATREGATSETHKNVPSAFRGGTPPLNPCGNTRLAKDFWMRSSDVLRGCRGQQAQKGTIIYTHRFGVLGNASVDRCRQRNSACAVPDLVKTKLGIRGPYCAILASEKHEGTS